MSNGKLIFGREPVAWTAFIAILVQLVSLWFPLTAAQQGLVNGLVVLVFGFVAAAMVSLEKAVPALIGAIQALAAVAVGFGAHISPDRVTVVTALIAGAAALWTRTQVVAPVGAEGASTLKSL